MRASASVAELAGAELAGADLPRDPADRILVATSRVLGATLVTQEMQEREGSRFSPDGTLSVPLLDGQNALTGAWDLLRELG